MGVFGDEVPSDDLRKSDVPRLDPRLPEAWMTFTRFAFTYDGYTHHGPDCGSIANNARGAYDVSGSLPESIDDIRACLFFEQRRWRHFAVDPNPGSWTYIERLLDRLRSLLPDRESIDALQMRLRTNRSTVLVFCESEFRIDLREHPKAEWTTRLQQRGLSGPFAVLAAANPHGETRTPEQNAAAANRLLNAARDVVGAEMPVRLWGCSPDLSHREASFAVELEERRAEALARRFRQDAYFWYDGARFWLVPLDERLDRMALPIDDGRDA